MITPPNGVPVAGSPIPAEGDAVSAETGGGGVSRVDRPRRWRLVERASADDVKRLARDLLVQPATAAVLANRGLADTAAAQTFLAPRFNQLPDPATMKNMEAALAVLVPAIKDRRRIVIHGDYDVDGVSGSVILTEFLRACGADVEPFIPDRKTHGYGFSRASLADCLALGAKIIVTCDCGTASVAEIDEAKAAGVDVVVTDHHEPGPVLPRAAALLNPRQAGETFPDKNLCGTGVAFFLIIALRRALREGGWFGASRPEPNLRALLDVVAIATIGDIVPLVGVNRILTREGLPMLSATGPGPSGSPPRVGLAALVAVAGLAGRTVGEYGVSFGLVPRINAAGRLGSARGALDLLLTKDPEVAKRLSLQLDAANKERQAIEARMLEEALAAVAADPSLTTASALVLADSRWHMGVVGIIAARLVDRFNKPSIALSIGADGRATGSARSIRHLNLVEALAGCAEHLQKWGGHPMAAGMTLGAEHIPAFRESFVRETGRRLSAEQLLPELLIDAHIQPEDLSDRLVEELARLSPHGMGNPEPVLLLRAARVTHSKVVGKNHLRLDLMGGRGRMEAIGFGFGECQSVLPTTLDLAVVPQRREWGGLFRTELRIRDLGVGAIERMGLLAA